MSKEILMVVDAVSNEKDVEKPVIFAAIEAALASATRKKNGDDILVRVSIDRTTGDYETFRRWQVVENYSQDEPDAPLRQIILEAAREDNPEVAIGDFIEEPIEIVMETVL